MKKYKSYGTLSKTTHFLSVFCGVGVVQQYTEAQEGVVKEELQQYKEQEVYRSKQSVKHAASTKLKSANCH